MNKSGLAWPSSRRFVDAPKRLSNIPNRGRYVPASRQEKDVDFLVHNSIHNTSLRFQVCAAASSDISVGLAQGFVQGRAGSHDFFTLPSGRRCYDSTRGDHPMKLRHAALTSLVLLTALTTMTSGQQAPADWPQWRGPNRDAAGSFTVPATWPEQLTQKWKVEVGLGYATPLVVGNRVYMFSRQGDNEVMSALDPANGMAVWQTRYPAAFTMHQAAARHQAGPKSTPAFANGLVHGE